MKDHLPTVIVLASGRGERFAASGGQVHKLSALLAGKRLIEHTLAAVQASGLAWRVEDAGHPGMGDSIAAAVRATPDAAGWMILPADLPLVSAATLRAVAQALTPPWRAVQPGYQGQRGHPVAFAADSRGDLLALQGNRGAAPVLMALRAAGSVLDIEVDDIGIVTDIDTLDDLAHAEECLQARGRT